MPCAADLYELVLANITADGRPRILGVGADGGAVPPGLNYTTVNITRRADGTDGLGGNITGACNNILAQNLRYRGGQTDTVQKLMLERRLGDSKTTGKIAARNQIYASIRNHIILQWPELFDPLFTIPRGSVAIGDMPNARLDVLQEQFLVGLTFSSQPQPASLNITRRSIYASNVTMQSIVERARARIEEVRFIQKELLGIPIPVDATYKYGFPEMTIESLLLAFQVRVFVLCA